MRTKYDPSASATPPQDQNQTAPRMAARWTRATRRRWRRTPPEDAPSTVTAGSYFGHGRVIPRRGRPGSRNARRRANWPPQARSRRGSVGLLGDTVARRLRRRGASGSRPIPRSRDRRLTLPISREAHMARVTVQDCLTQVNNHFALVILAANRARQIALGGRRLVECDNKSAVAALREIGAGK